MGKTKAKRKAAAVEDGAEQPEEPVVRSQSKTKTKSKKGKKARRTTEAEEEEEEEGPSIDTQDPPGAAMEAVDEAGDAEMEEEEEEVAVAKAGKGKTGKKRKPHAEGEDKGDRKRNEERKRIRLERKVETNPSYTLVQDLKVLWEEGRHRKTSKERRTELIGQILAKSRGKLSTILFQHESARVIQFCFKHGTAIQKASLFDELEKHIPELAKSQYSKFIVNCILNTGSKPQRQGVVTAFCGQVAKLVRHKFAAELLAAAYIDHATHAQRRKMVQELYGPQFALFKTPEVETLPDLKAKAPEQLVHVLKHMKTSFGPLLDKQICAHHLVHKALRDYMEVCEQADLEELVEACQEMAVAMLHTRDGARVAMKCVWNGPAKSRKVLVRSFKTFVTKICQEQFGHLVLLAVFDAVDDTVLVKKIVLSEIAQNLSDIAGNAFGQKVLLYLLSPRNTKYFSPDVLTVLAQGDGNKFTKKDTTKKRGELDQGILTPLFKYVQANLAALATSAQGTFLIFETLAHASTVLGDEELLGAFKALADLSGKLIEESFGHRLLKRLCLHDFGPDKPSFVATLFPAVRDAAGALTKTNHGAFVFESMIAGADAKLAAKIKKALKPLQAKLADSDSKGPQILAEVVQGKRKAGVKGSITPTNKKKS